ncbi:MAG: hypothetical protein IKD94_06765 [Erysipelotrichaceae bacterium]|nr:hypothetical protein [Erysipelotrichaceae bacterium]
MELKDFEKLEFVFENVTSMTVRKEDINYIHVQDRPNRIGKTSLRRVKINLKANARPLEVNPELSFVSETDRKYNNMSRRVINRFEYYRGRGDIVCVTLFKNNSTRQYLYPYWCDMLRQDSFDENNLYQYSGFETDENYEFTGNYEIEFFVAAKKDYECADEGSRFLGCCAYPGSTGLPYKLLFSSGERRNYLDSCVLIDTEDQYIPVAVDGSKEVYIKNVWLNDLRPYDRKKVEECMDFIQQHYREIREHEFNRISDNALLNSLQVIVEE